MPYKRQADRNANARRRYSERSDVRAYHVRKAREAQQRHRAWLREVKNGLVCKRCGEDHPACLDFHHRDPDAKDFNLSEAARMGWSRTRVLEEIAKCEVLCANCHRKVHAEATVKGR